MTYIHQSVYATDGMLVVINLYQNVNEGNEEKKEEVNEDLLLMKGDLGIIEELMKKSNVKHF